MNITNEHLILLRAMCEHLELDENLGTVPCFDSKRPYGFRDWITDVGELLGVKQTVVVDEGFDGTLYYGYSQEDKDRFSNLQSELPEVLKKIIMEYNLP